MNLTGSTNPHRRFFRWLAISIACFSAGVLAVPEAGAQDVFQPDLMISRKNDSSRKFGDNQYEEGDLGRHDPRTGRILGIFMKQREKTHYFLFLQNDGNVTDDFFLRAKPTRRTLRVRFFQMTGGRKNVTARVLADGLRLRNVPPLLTVKYRVEANWTKRVQATWAQKRALWRFQKGKRRRVIHEATSVGDPGARDAITAEFNRR